MDEHNVIHMLAAKKGTAPGFPAVILTGEEYKQVLLTMDDLIKRNESLQHENTHLSLFNFQRG